jgi:antitoxin (DNA-binding transcriptional repressor) of toxin-antitoxin stability system
MAANRRWPAISSYRSSSRRRTTTWLSAPPSRCPRNVVHGRIEPRCIDRNRRRLHALDNAAKRSSAKIRLNLMTRTLTATELARNFREVLDQVERSGETVRIERHGHVIAELGPAESGRRFTGRDLARLLERLPVPDESFAADLAKIRAESRAAPVRNPWQVWASSSTVQS